MESQARLLWPPATGFPWQCGISCKGRAVPTHLSAHLGQVAVAAFLQQLQSGPHSQPPAGHWQASLHTGQVMAGLNWPAMGEQHASRVFATSPTPGHKTGRACKDGKGCQPAPAPQSTTLCCPCVGNRS